MTDLEMTKLCAEAMGMGTEIGYKKERHPYDHANAKVYNPLQDDAQAMALVKKFGMTCDPAEDEPPFTWRVCAPPIDGDWDNAIQTDAQDLNRAIVECVAKMQNASPRPQLSPTKGE